MAALATLSLVLGLYSLLGAQPVQSGRMLEPKVAQDESSYVRAGGTSRAGSSTASGGRRRASESMAGRNCRPCSASSSESEANADISVQVEFDSSPAVVRKAITKYVKACYPQAVSYLKWDDTGTSVSASNLGASGSITLLGSGPTLVQISGDIGFPASLFVSEKVVRIGLNQAIRDIKKRTS